MALILHFTYLHDVWDGQGAMHGCAVESDVYLVFLIWGLLVSFVYLLAFFFFFYNRKTKRSRKEVVSNKWGYTDAGDADNL